MSSKSFFSLFGSVLALSYAFTIASSQATPAPGAIAASLSIPSINNIMNTFVPTLAYYMVDNKTLELNLHEKGILYSLNIQDIHLNTVDFNTKSIGFLHNTSTIRVELSGVNVNMNVDGEIKALWLIPLKTSQCNITNLTVVLDIGVETSD